MIIGKRHTQEHTPLLIGAEADGAGFQGGRASVDVNREGHSVPDIARFVFRHRFGLNGIVVLAIGQRIALVVHAKPGLCCILQEMGGGNHCPFTSVEGGLRDISGFVGPKNLAVFIGNAIAHHRCIPQKAKTGDFHAIHFLVVVGRDDEVLTLNGNGLIGAQIRAQLHRKERKPRANSCGIVGIGNLLVIEHGSVIEHTRLGPVAIEGDKRNAEHRGGAGISGGQADKAFHENAVFKLPIQRFLLLLRQLEGHGDLLRRSAGRQHHGSLAASGVIQQHIPSAHKSVAVPLLHIGSHGNHINVIGTGGIPPKILCPEGNGVLTCLCNVIAQICHWLCIAIGVCIGEQVHITFHSGIEVNPATALKAGRIGELCGRIIYNSGGGHKEILRRLRKLTGLNCRPGLRNPLLHQNAGASHIGGGHGRTAHNSIATLLGEHGNGGVYTAARSRDLRLQPQIRRHADAGKGRYLPSSGVFFNQIVCLQGDPYAGTFQLCQLSANVVADETGGNLIISRRHYHVISIGMVCIIVIDNHANGVIPGCIHHFVGKGDVAAISGQAAPLHDSNLTGHVNSTVVGILAIAGNHHVIIGWFNGALYITGIHVQLYKIR